MILTKQMLMDNDIYGKKVELFGKNYPDGLQLNEASCAALAATFDFTNIALPKLLLHFEADYLAVRGTCYAISGDEFAALEIKYKGAYGSNDHRWPIGAWQSRQAEYLAVECRRNMALAKVFGKLAELLDAEIGV